MTGFVTALQEGAADYSQMQEEIERAGYAWAGIGAQASGVNAPRTGLKAWDAERYRSLEHPGDAYSYDIFSQGGQALLHPTSVDPLAVCQIVSTFAINDAVHSWLVDAYALEVVTRARQRRDAAENRRMNGVPVPKVGPTGATA